MKKLQKNSVVLSLILLMVLDAGAQLRKKLLDSLNAVAEPHRGTFQLYIIRPAAEIVVSGYRNRDNAVQGFRPFAFSYFFYLPFQYDLSYVHIKAKEKLIKLNTVFIVHHSTYFNYALGLGERLSFLIIKHTYFSYQGGLAWCEVVNKKANDGIHSMGFSFHHTFSLNYTCTQRFQMSLNVSHISGGNLFPKMNNNQDAVGVGAFFKL
jgi:hypothetical protein